MKIGNGLHEDTDIGPLIDKPALEKVREHINDALEKGAQLMCGGGTVFSEHGNY